ncbi:MAG: hypothetical protein WCP89_03555 [archaeon]
MNRIEDVISCWPENSEVYHDHLTIVEIGKTRSRVTIANSENGEVYFEVSRDNLGFKDLEEKPYLFSYIRDSLLSELVVNS